MVEILASMFVGFGVFALLVLGGAGLASFLWALVDGKLGWHHWLFVVPFVLLTLTGMYLIGAAILGDA